MWRFSRGINFVRVNLFLRSDKVNMNSNFINFLGRNENVVERKRKKNGASNENKKNARRPWPPRTTLLP